MTSFSRVYSRQEHLTPGAAETVELIADWAGPDQDALLVDVAAGKGEAACTLAGRFACRVLALDTYDPFIHYMAAKAWHWNLGDLVAVLRADGRRLPLPDSVCDLAYCIGAPSIVGLEPCLAELARVVKPNGHVAVSDIVWRQKPTDPLGPEWGWLARHEPKLSDGEYAAAVEAAGLRIDRVHRHERSAWDGYHRPMLAVAQEARASDDPEDAALAGEIERQVERERRAADTFLDYATFLARKPERQPRR